jgi:hypothetical protein
MLDDSKSLVRDQPFADLISSRNVSTERSGRLMCKSPSNQETAMDILVGVLVIGGFIVGGMLLHHFGENLADGADHPVLKVLGIIIMAVGIAIGALITAGIANTAREVPYQDIPHSRPYQP